MKKYPNTTSSSTPLHKKLAPLHHFFGAPQEVLHPFLELVELVEITHHATGYTLFPYPFTQKKEKVNTPHEQCSPPPSTPPGLASPPPFLAAPPPRLASPPPGLAALPPGLAACAAAAHGLRTIVSHRPAAAELLSRRAGAAAVELARRFLPSSRGISPLPLPQSRCSCLPAGSGSSRRHAQTLPRPALRAARARGTAAEATTAASPPRPWASPPPPRSAP